MPAGKLNDRDCVCPYFKHHEGNAITCEEMYPGTTKRLMFTKKEDKKLFYKYKCCDDYGWTTCWHAMQLNAKYDTDCADQKQIDSELNNIRRMISCNDLVQEATSYPKSMNGRNNMERDLSIPDQVRIGVIDYVKDGILYRNRPIHLILVTNESKLPELTGRYEPGSLAYTSGVQFVWQLSPDGHWIPFSNDMDNVRHAIMELWMKGGNE